MAGVQQHIVKKFSLELETADNGEQYKLQRHCSNMVKEKMAPAMDEIFTTYFPGHAITRINKIEIDLGNIDADKLEEVFIQECVKQLKQKIKNFAITAQKSEATLIQSIPKSQNLLEQFFYFLETGILLFPATGRKSKEWEQSIIASVKEQKDFFAVHFQQLIQQHRIAAERLAAQFDIDFINALLNAADAVYENGFRDIYEKLQLKIQALQTGTNKKLLVTAVIQMLCDVQIKEWKQFLSSLAEHIDIPVTAGDEYPVTIEQWKNYLSASNKIFPLPQQPGGAKKEYTKTMQVNEEKRMPVNEQTPATEVKSNGVFIDNAGLVILHPFLETLFETLGFAQNKSFINDACSYRAVHLLQYMATNEEATPEYIMPLNKLLCGIPAEEHTDRFIQLNENEKEEAQRLLQSVIGHWSILKQTSVEGLRQAFLQRRGKLSFNKTDAYWKLQVEKSAIDILLGKLPWGYSYIQLPWMQHRLITEWQNY